MVDGYTKLFSSITDSSVWQEEDHVRLLWITMLAMADARGYVGASVPGLAARARITLEQCEEALAKFLAPDPYSRSEKHEGRRIEKVDRGWILLNYARFREMRNVAETRERQREWARRKRASTSTNVDNRVDCRQMSTQAEAEAEADIDPPVVPPSGDATQKPKSRPRGRKRKPETVLATDWQPTDSHRAFASELGVDCDREARRFRAHAEANDRRMRDWDAAFRMWLDKATDFADGDASRRSAQQELVLDGDPEAKIQKALRGE